MHGALTSLLPEPAARMDSPPPTQVPLSRESFPMDNRLPPSPPPPPPGLVVSSSSSNNGLPSPPPHSVGGHMDRGGDGDLMVSGLGNGLTLGHTPLSIAAQAHAAAIAAAQYHHNQMVAAHAHSARHHQVMGSPINPLLRKNLIPKPGAPYPSPPPVSGDHACKMIKYRDREVAAFMVDNRELICLPQAFELFLKDLVGGLHTVYTKLKRLDIQPVVCNVEQVRILRGLGAIAPGVNRCKLISCSEFDVLYDDCTNSNARPGRPPKRSPSIHHATPETLDKLNKKREEMGYGFDPRYYGEPKTMMNGFPHGWSTPLSPYLHMGINPTMMGQHMPAIMAASQYASMRADSNAAAAAAAAAAAGSGGVVKDRMESEMMGRQGQERLAAFGLFSPPSLHPDNPLMPRHPDDPKPINLSNGHARSSLAALPAPPSGIKDLGTDDDDEEDMMANEDKNNNHSDDDNDADMVDDNSNDGASDVGYSGRDLMNKTPMMGMAGSTDGRHQDDLGTPVNGGSAGTGGGSGSLGHLGMLPGMGMVPGGASGGRQTPTELEKTLQGLADMVQKVISTARCMQRQSNLERDELLSMLRDNELTVQDLKRNLNDARSKNEELRSRLKKERKESRKMQQQETPVPGGEGHMSGSPGQGHNGGGGVGSGGGGGSAVNPPELGLDLAIKPLPSPEEPPRTHTTDGAEPEQEAEKAKPVPERDVKIPESSSDRVILRESFDVFSAAAALASSGAVAGGSPPVRFPAPPYLSLIGSEVQ